MLAACALLAACGSSNKAGVAGPSEVALQPVSKAGANPFMPPVGKDMAGVMPPSVAATQTGGGLPTYNADLPGLCGGTRNYSACDASKMVVFLEQNPAKAAAWASTLGIQTTQIRDYVSGLTAVILRTDTRVTNHGYINGVADAIPAVLEAGTAVLVDKYGRPVVKCYCGNPLTSDAVCVADLLRDAVGGLRADPHHDHQPVDDDHPEVHTLRPDDRPDLHENPGDRWARRPLRAARVEPHLDDHDADDGDATDPDDTIPHANANADAPDSGATAGVSFGLLLSEPRPPGGRLRPVRVGLPPEHHARRDPHPS